MKMVAEQKKKRKDEGGRDEMNKIAKRRRKEKRGR